MGPIDDSRQETALEIRRLAEEFERDDERAFRRVRIACWVVVALLTIVVLGLLMIGGDAIYLGGVWVIIVVLVWVGYGLSSRRQRQQTGRLKVLAARLSSAGASGGRSQGIDAGVLQG